MTENVRKEMLKDIKDGYIDAWDNFAIDELFKQIEKEHEEIQQYRAIGTVEEFNRARQMEAVYGQVKWERDIAISQLEEIGVDLGQKMDEFKALKEKSVAKKPIETMMCYKAVWKCPTCSCRLYSGQLHCEECGQAILDDYEDWQ